VVEDGEGDDAEEHPLAEGEPPPQGGCCASLLMRTCR
jgi:hypothetical protein